MGWTYRLSSRQRQGVQCISAAYKKVSGYSPEVKVIGNYHHAYVGGAIAGKQYGKSADNLILNQILSHHSGLHDSDEIDAAIKKEMDQNHDGQLPPEINTDIGTIKLNKPPFVLSPNDFHHLARCLSCLVDADYLDTESFMDKTSELRSGKATLTELLSKLEKYLLELKANATDSAVNHVQGRSTEQMLQDFRVSNWLFSLTVPTEAAKRCPHWFGR